MGSLPNYSDPALQAWQRWHAAKTQVERSQHTTRLWHLCAPVIFAALRDLAEELSERLKRHVSVHDWLQRHNMEEADAFSAAWLGVERATKNFNPNNRTKFQTYAYDYIKRAIRDQTRGAWSWDSNESGIEGGRETKDWPNRPDDMAKDDTAEEELDFIRFLADLIGVPAGQLTERIYQGTKEMSKTSVEELEVWFDTSISPEQRRKNPTLDVVRSALIAQHIRAVDREGGMVQVSDLAQMLRARERGESRQGRNPYSPHALSKQFPYSDKTIKRWLSHCEELRITADNRDPERLARIMTPRRGPTAG
jgi:hypothetical protein